jgi:hypothetical protein
LPKLLAVQADFCSRFGNVALVAVQRSTEEITLKSLYDLLLALN